MHKKHKSVGDFSVSNLSLTKERDCMKKVATWLVVIAIIIFVIA